MAPACGGPRTVGDRSGGVRATPEAARAADQRNAGRSAGQAARIGIGELVRDSRRTVAQRAALGDADRPGVRAVLQLIAFLEDLADVDDEGAHPGQDPAADKDRDDDPDRATLIPPQPQLDQADERGHQVSHGATPWADRTIGEPKPAPPISPAIAPTGVMNENV